MLLPASVAAGQAGIVANVNTKQAYQGQYLSFNLNLNLPPPCTTGFLPAQQQRIPSFEDYPDSPAGDLYCRIPQDSPLNVRGAKNIPCETVPGKRAPTVKMCESDEQYVPLNDGYNWKGDPNATLSGQDIPQLPPGSPPAAPGPPDGPPITDSHRRVRPRHRHLRRAERASLHAIRSVANPTEGQDVAIDDGAAGKLTTPVSHIPARGGESNARGDRF